MKDKIFDSTGHVSLKDYLSIDKLGLYQDMEKFSDLFLTEQASLLKSYSRSWVKDPFHQWSRRFEYPWVAHQLSRANLPKSAKILDAGSGLTFFPFYLVEQNPDYRVHCLDIDARLVNPYEKIARTLNKDVHFNHGSLKQIPFPHQTFDAVYCISVLEHTDNYEDIVKEFHRVLKPGGLVLITFDICLNQVADISPKRAQDLISIIKKYFSIEMKNHTDHLFENTEERTDLVSTKWALQHSPQSIPWRFPTLSAIKASIKSRHIRSFINLTFFTVCGRKN